MTKYKIQASVRFQKDVKLAQKRGFKLDKLTEVIKQLADGNPLPPKNKDHALTGNWHRYRECHIEPDWLLIYSLDDTILTLYLTRTGTHSDLF